MISSWSWVAELSSDLNDFNNSNSYSPYVPRSEHNRDPFEGDGLFIQFVTSDIIRHIL